MRQPLLTIVQRTLSSMDSDAVDSINDTEEAEQVATIAQEVYEEWISAKEDWPFLLRALGLESISDITRPNYLRIANPVSKVESVHYNIRMEEDGRSRMTLLMYKTPEDFFSFVHQRNEEDANVEMVEDPHGMRYPIRNDKHPQFWTTLDDKHIVFDSYKSDLEDTLQANQSFVYAYEIPQWTNANGAIPDLPDKFFPSYIAAVKARAHLYLKREQSVADEQSAFRGFNRMLKEANIIRGKDTVRRGFGRR